MNEETRRPRCRRARLYTLSNWLRLRCWWDPVVVYEKSPEEFRRWFDPNYVDRKFFRSPRLFEVAKSRGDNSMLEHIRNDREASHF